MRVRVSSSTLIRSSDPDLNSRIVRKQKQHRKRIEKTRTMEVFIKNAFGTKNRFIYIGTP
jgi:hypothetical protein